MRTCPFCKLVNPDSAERCDCGNAFGGNAFVGVCLDHKCPYCAETIKAEAVVCRFCGKNIKRDPGARRNARNAITARTL